MMSMFITLLVSNRGILTREQQLLNMLYMLVFALVSIFGRYTILSA